MSYFQSIGIGQGAQQPSLISEALSLTGEALSLLGSELASTSSSSSGDSISNSGGASTAQSASSNNEEAELQYIVQLMSQLLSTFAGTNDTSNSGGDTGDTPDSSLYGDGSDPQTSSAPQQSQPQASEQSQPQAQPQSQPSSQPQGSQTTSQRTTPHTSLVGSSSAGASTGSGGPADNPTNNPLLGKVDPNSPIYIPLNSDGSYNAKALAALAQQGYASAGVTQAQAQADSGPKAGNAGTDGGTWTVSDGFAKGILYGGAALASAASDGFTDKTDQEYAVTQSSVETGTDGSLSGRRDFTQGAGTGVGTHGQGPIQLDSQWHDQTDANNPFVAFTRAWEIGKTINGGSAPSLREDGIVYNSGNPGDTQGQTEVRDGKSISYGAYWDSLVAELPND